jgi:hypothetical protein
MTEEKKCDVCGRTFKTPQALAGHMQGPCGNQNPETSANAGKETRAASKTGSLDAAIEKLNVPTVPAEYNGYSQVYWEGFNKGVNYGATTILVGIRSAQELSSLGISQATPIIKMAQEMRQAEGQAAQELAAQLGQVSMQGNQQILAALNKLASSQKQSEPDPFSAMTARMMEPMLVQAMNMLSGSLFKIMPQMNMGQQPLPDQQGTVQPGAGQTVTGDVFGSLPENITNHSLNELEEEQQ